MCLIRKALKIITYCLPLTLLLNTVNADSIKPVLGEDGNLAYIEIVIDNTTFTVTTIGKVASIDPPANVSGKNSTSQRINNVPVFYETCKLNTRSGNPYHSPRYNSNSKTQQLDRGLRAFAAATSCPNQNGTLGKVRQIGTYSFTYYTPNSFNSMSPNSAESGSIDKIKTAGPYRFTYYSLGAFGNKGGKVKDIINSDSQ